VALIIKPKTSATPIDNNKFPIVKFVSLVTVSKIDSNIFFSSYIIADYKTSKKSSKKLSYMGFCAEFLVRF